MIESQEHTEIEVGSSRSFGVVFFVIFTLIGLYPLLNSNPPFIIMLGLGSIFLLLALVKPTLLDPLNKLWFRFGMFLAKIVNPIVMFIIYVTTMLPIGILLRLSGKDLLRKKLDPEAESYWIVRDPSGPEPESLTEQF